MAYQRVVYLSGPYRADTAFQMNLHIAEFRKWAQIVLECGWAVIDPIAQTKWMDGCGIEPEQFIQADLAIIERLIPGRDMVLMLNGYEHSEGSGKEWLLAAKLSLTVLYANDEEYMRKWLLASREWKESQ